MESRTTGQTIEVVRYLYEVEAPQAFDVLMIDVRADELEKQATGSPPTSRIHREAAVVRRSANALAQAYADTRGAFATNELLTDPRYRTADGGFDVRQRLRDLHREEQSAGADVPKMVADGNAAATWVQWWTAGMVLSLLPPLAGMTIWLWELRRQRSRAARRGRGPRRREPLAQDEPPEVGFGPPSLPGSLPAQDAVGTDHVVIVGIGLLLAILATLFTAAQLRSDLDESEAFGAAARQAAQVTALAAGGGVREAFRDGAKYEIALLRTQQEQQVALIDAATSDDDAGDARIAAAAEAVAHRLDGIVTTMAAPPRSDDELAAPIRTVVSATRADALGALDQQHGSVTAAERAGGRSNTLVVALFAITVAALMLDVAGAARYRRRRLILGSLVMAVIAVMTAVLPTTI